jgi:hypothetical protein
MPGVVMSAAWASNMRRSIATYQADHGDGARSLLLAVIGAAVLDLADPDQAQAAAVYFLSPLYRHHVEALGLPGDYLPTGVSWSLLARIAGVTQ